jgi:hypothetical protein
VTGLTNLRHILQNESTGKKGGYMKENEIILNETEHMEKIGEQKHSCQVATSVLTT